MKLLLIGIAFTGLAMCQLQVQAPLASVPAAPPARPTSEQAQANLVGKSLPALDNFNAAKAKYSLVTFMSSTCLHCQNEVPNLIKLDRLAGNGESPAVGVLRGQCIELIRHGQFEDAASMLADLGKLKKIDAAKPRAALADVQIVPVFHAQDPGADRFLESAQWNVTPALFTKLDQAFPISGTPTTVLVDGAGKVLQAWVGEMRPGVIEQLGRFVKHPAMDVFVAPVSMVR